MPYYLNYYMNFHSDSTLFYEYKNYLIFYTLLLFIHNPLFVLFPPDWVFYLANSFSCFSIWGNLIQIQLCKGMLGNNHPHIHHNHTHSFYTTTIPSSFYQVFLPTSQPNIPFHIPFICSSRKHSHREHHPTFYYDSLCPFITKVCRFSYKLYIATSTQPMSKLNA